MIIYLDFILLLSLFINGFILYFVRFLLHHPYHFIRHVLGTLFASLLTPILLIFPNIKHHTFYLIVIYSIIIVLVTFGYTRLRATFKQLFLFYFITMCVGGGMLSFHHLSNYIFQDQQPFYLFYLQNIQKEYVSVVLIFIFIPIFIVCIKLQLDKWKDRSKSIRFMYRMTIYWNDSSYDTVGFIDSGNYLVDPLTERPVIICDETYIKKFFSQKEWRQLKKAIIRSDSSYIPVKYIHQFSIIPFRSIGSASNILFAFKPERLVIHDQKNQIVTNKVLVGIHLSPFSNDGEYHCLLHPKLVA